MKYDYRVEDKGDYALVILPEKVMIPHSDHFRPAMREAFEQRQEYKDLYRIKSLEINI